MKELSVGSAVVFMKIGTHAQEPLELIIERKRKELRAAGVSFWGYGGNTCHPGSFVRPFAESHARGGRTVHLVMQKMTSRHVADPQIAREYSEDSVIWRPIPRHVEVRGSTYALVLGALEEVDFSLDLNSLQVARGKSLGRSGTEYLRGHVDKGCFEIGPRRGETPEQNIRISLVGKLVEPYAVFLR